MDFRFAARLLFFVAGGLFAGWHVQRAYRTNTWPRGKIRRDESPIAFWSLMLVASVMLLGAIGGIVTLLVQKLAQ